MCVYEQVCVCVLFKFSYQLCAAKIISSYRISTLTNYDDELHHGRGRGHRHLSCSSFSSYSSSWGPVPVQSSLNLRLSCRRNNWETRTCPCRDFGHCPAVQLNVFVRTSARTWSCIRWADRTGSSMCLSCREWEERGRERKEAGKL